MCIEMTSAAHAASATYKRDNKWERGVDRPARLGVLRPCIRRIVLKLGAPRPV
jgi:hypothetical protein